jgi:hypothetical protein
MVERPSLPNKGELHNITVIGSMEINFTDRFPNHHPSEIPFFE